MIGTEKIVHQIVDLKWVTINKFLDRTSFSNNSTAFKNKH